MQEHIFNSSAVQLSVEGTNGETYFLPPKKVSKLPAGVKVKDESLGPKLKRTKPPVR